jgi:AhpD family alkylhydroperoxidase
METKTKLLIAVGAAFNANCQPCLKNTVKKALDAGANKKEIAEAIGVSKVVRKTAMTQIDRFASGIAEIEADEGSPNSCGCSYQEQELKINGGEKNE